VNNKINALQTDSKVIYPFMRSARCGAKTRLGTPCLSPAVRDHKRCRMHGGTNKGAPMGNSNALKHGFTTKETKAIRKAVKQCFNNLLDI
jgi:hypothetical protein